MRNTLVSVALALPVLVFAEQTPRVPDASSEDVLRWLRTGAYRAWASETRRHASAGPHFGEVRTFVNSTLYDSLQSSSRRHPVGAMAVKELHRVDDAPISIDGLTCSDTTAPVGWAVSMKLAQDSADGSNWYWFEYVDKYLIADGTGVVACVECHRAGGDQILSTFARP